MAGPAQRKCSCGSMIWLLPTPAGGTMPVDVGRDPDGNLLAVRLRGGRWGVRALTDAERAAGVAGVRYTAHWSTCPHAEQYRDQARRLAPETYPSGRGRQVTTAGRAGPCAKCGNTHPDRYGPGPSWPLCATCRGETGPPAVTR